MKILKKLRTASLNSEFTDSYKKSVTSNFDFTNAITNEPKIMNFGCATSSILQ